MVPGPTGFTSQFTRLEFLGSYDARFVIVTQGPIGEALAYKRRVGNTMTWYSTANSPFGSDVAALYGPDAQGRYLGLLDGHSLGSIAGTNSGGSP